MRNAYVNFKVVSLIAALFLTVSTPLTLAQKTNIPSDTCATDALETASMFGGSTPPNISGSNLTAPSASVNQGYGPHLGQAGRALLGNTVRLEKESSLRVGYSARIFSALLTDWNPRFTNDEVLAAIDRNASSGIGNPVESGLASPLMATIDYAYRTFPEPTARAIGSVLNPALAAINPFAATHLCRSLKLPAKSMFPSGSGNIDELREQITKALAPLGPYQEAKKLAVKPTVAELKSESEAGFSLYDVVLGKGSAFSGRMGDKYEEVMQDKRTIESVAKDSVASTSKSGGSGLTETCAGCIKEGAKITGATAAGAAIVAFKAGGVTPAVVAGTSALVVGTIHTIVRCDKPCDPKALPASAAASGPARASGGAASSPRAAASGVAPSTSGGASAPKPTPQGKPKGMDLPEDVREGGGPSTGRSPSDLAPAPTQTTPAPSPGLCRMPGEPNDGRPMCALPNVDRR